MKSLSLPNIILTGFMGTGKTTVGTLLAKRLQYRFVDTDQLIEQRCGMTVHEVFRTRGEQVFRDMEAETARELGGGEGVVISTGGRLMLDPANAQALTAKGRVFCLVATPEEILHRVSADNGGKRPLLDSANPLARVVELLEERRGGYAQFTQITTSGRSPQQIVSQILEILGHDSGGEG
jgi:shikimate kinase